MRGRRILRRNHTTPSAAGVLDLSTLSLTLWVDGDSGMVTGKASAGTSGSLNLTATGSPAAGAGLDGGGTLLLDGVNDKLSYSLSNGAGDIYSDAAYTFAAVAKVTSIPTDLAVTSAFSNAGLSQESGGNHALAFASTGPTLQAYQNTVGGLKTKTLTTATSTWKIFQMRFTGTALEIRDDGGAWQSSTFASTTASSFTFRTFYIGTDYTGAAQFLTGELAEILATNTALDDATMNNVVASLRAKYPSIP